MGYGFENKVQWINKAVLTGRIRPPPIMRSITPAVKKKSLPEWARQLLAFRISRRYYCSKIP